MHHVIFASTKKKINMLVFLTTLVVAYVHRWRNNFAPSTYCRVEDLTTGQSSERQFPKNIFSLVFIFTKKKNIKIERFSRHHKHRINNNNKKMFATTGAHFYWCWTATIFFWCWLEFCFEQSFSQQGCQTQECPTTRLLRSCGRWLPGHVSICCLHAVSIMRLILVTLPSVNRLTQQSASSLLLIALTHPTRPPARLRHHLLDLFLASYTVSWLPLAPSFYALLITFLR